MPACCCSADSGVRRKWGLGQFGSPVRGDSRVDADLLSILREPEACIYCPADSGVRRGWGWGDVGGLSEETLESMRLREENELLMENLVRSKLEMAETQSEC